jgi:hypothetical protein
MNTNALFFDVEVARKYLDYDTWLNKERLRNWSAYTTYLQAAQLVQQQRLQLLQHQYTYYEYNRLVQEQRLLLLQEQEKQQQKQEQQQQDEADYTVYMAEIDAGREKDLVPERDMREIAEERQTFKEQRRERVRIYHQDKRRSINEDKRTGKHTMDYFQQVRDNTPMTEVPRADYFNADKPPRNQRYQTSDKLKSKKFYNRRKFGSGWAKQLE